MARWKMAGHMAVAMREAERQAELRRILEEQRMESIKNGKILRKLGRNRDILGYRAARERARDQRLCRSLVVENGEQTMQAAIASSPYFQRIDTKNHETLLDYLTKMDDSNAQAKTIKGEMELTNLKMKENDAELKIVRKKLRILIRKLDNVHVISDDKVKRRQEVMEQKCGLQLAENRRLKDMISHLEGEQTKVKELHTELELQLLDLSKQLGGHIEEARTTYERRDMNKRNMVKLKEHLQKSAASFDSDMQLLQFKIDVLKRMERFMTSKNRFRPDDGRERRQKNRLQLSATEKDSIMYGNLMTRIKDDLEEDNLHVIIKTFVELEEENYMLFKNVSETRDQCQTMQVEIDEARQKIKDLRKVNQQEEQERMARKMELIEKINICSKEAATTEEYCANADVVIATYIQGVLAILHNLGYSTEDIHRLAGVLKTVQEQNISVYMAEIESYVNSLYELKTTHEFLKWERARKMTMVTVTPEPMPPRLTLVARVVVVPPLHDEAEEVEDPFLPAEASFRPLTCTEMTYHVEEDLDTQAGDPTGVSIPSPTMRDQVSDATGTSPQLPTSGRPNYKVDVL